MNRLGKNTPVWKNTRDGRVLCGATVQDALGTAQNNNVDLNWERVNSLPNEERVVIRKGQQLRNQKIAREIALLALKTGPLTIELKGRVLHFLVTYADETKVIVETQQRREAKPPLTPTLI